MRPKRWTDDDLVKAVAESKTYKEVVIALGLSPSSRRTQDRIRYRCNELNIDRSHFFFGGQTGSRRHRTDEQIFANGVQYSATTRRRFLELVEYKCRRCGISEWLGEKIVLQIEHIDGEKFNNQLDNLELLCPNCHSQTPTWGIQKSNRKTCPVQTHCQQGTSPVGKS